MITDTAGNQCSDVFGQLMLDGAREIIGQAGVNAVLNRALVFHQQGAKDTKGGVGAVDIQSALEELYGLRGGRGVALRAGRASFEQFLRMQGKDMGLMELNFRMLPSQARLYVGLQLLAQKMSELSTHIVNVEDHPDSWHWKIERDPQTGKGCLARGICHFMVGFLQEYLMWASGGKYHHVQEVENGLDDRQTCLIHLEKGGV
jgi:hypothetical protein